MSNEPKQHQAALIFALPPIRPDVDSGGYILDRGAIMSLAKELIRHARNQNVKAIRVSIEPNGVQVGIASHRPPVN